MSQEGVIQIMQQMLLEAFPDPEGVVARSLAMAERCHEGQSRLSGEPYLVHPLSVATYLMELKMDAESIAAALLHDTIEDTGITRAELAKQFGERIAVLVDALTKLAKIENISKEERNAESLRRMMLAMAQDVRVVIIKLADRLHNMQTLSHQSPEARIRISQETLDIYAPLAHRLGMYQMCTTLEDICLMYLHPEEYRSINRALYDTMKEQQGWMQSKLEQIRERVAALGIEPFELESRTKHLYSIYRKMQDQNRSFHQIYDVFAFRVIVPQIKDCYAVLGMVHTYYKPVPGRFKDYISVSKANQYQSLHTTVVGSSGIPFEVQIRTFEMHRQAEYGVAAHWMYKEGVQQADAMQTTLSWFRQFMKEQSDVADAMDFVDTLKTDLQSEEVYVFTPKGRVVKLPAGATPVDFAYSIHSQIGDRCMGAKANSRIIPLDTPLHSGDIVEIITGTSKGPSRDWLQFCKTSSAKSKIRAWFKREEKEENVVKGREMLELAAKRLGFTLTQLFHEDYLAPLMSRYTMKTLDDLYASVGCGGLTTLQVLMRLSERYKKDHELPTTPMPQRRAHKDKFGDQGVLVTGQPDMLVRLSSCCNPVPGDDIIGYITRGRGVSVHRTDCPNMAAAHSESESQRLVEVTWNLGTSGAFRAQLTVISDHRNRLLADITIALSDMGIPLLSIAANMSREGQHDTINLACEIQDIAQLDQLVYRLKRIDSVQEVHRTGRHV